MDDRRIVDLSLLIAEELPCSWDSHMPFQHKTFNYFDTIDNQDAPLLSRAGVGSYQTRWMLIDEHTGTHIDAPAHFLPSPGTGLAHANPSGATTVDRVPLGQTMGNAVVVDVTRGLEPAYPGTSPRVTPDILRQHEDVHGRFQPGDVVLLRGDWDVHYQPGLMGLRYGHDPLVTKEHSGWPAPDVDAIRLLLRRGVSCIGTDAPSLGPCEDGAEVHRVGLGGGAVFLEGLANLRELPPTGAWFCFTPLRVARGTGAPGRAFAMLSAPVD